MKDIARNLAYMEFYQRENALEHSSMKSELTFYDYVKRGDLEGVKRTSSPLGGKGFGKLSSDPLRNLKYHLIITIAFITRFCVEGGMERETAYNLSDLYILKTDMATSQQEIHNLHRSAVQDFTIRMALVNKANTYSKPVVQCFEYVYMHLNEKITLPKIAESVNLSPAYLSRLFHTETGKTLMEYITAKRIETSCNMLKFSDYSIAEIAEFLSFSSHSRFSDLFKKRTGLTPHEYRNRFFYLTDLKKDDTV